MSIYVCTDCQREIERLRAQLKNAGLRLKLLSITVPLDLLEGGLPNAYARGYEVAWRGWGYSTTSYKWAHHQSAYRRGFEQGARDFNEELSK